MKRTFTLLLLLVATLFGSVVPAAFGESLKTQPETEALETKSPTPVADFPRGVVQLDETVISGNQELPKVLYILPWREPQGLPDIEIQAEFSEAMVFKRLYPPAYRRELKYFDTLEGALKQNQED